MHASEVKQRAHDERRNGIGCAVIGHGTCVGIALPGHLVLALGLGSATPRPQDRLRFGVGHGQLVQRERRNTAQRVRDRCSHGHRFNVALQIHQASVPLDDAQHCRLGGLARRVASCSTRQQ